MSQIGANWYDQRPIQSTAPMKLPSIGTESPSPQPPTQEQLERADKIIEKLPETQKFAKSLPRHIVQQKAAENDQKAIKATHLLHRVDELIHSHVTAAHDLRKYVEGLSDVKTQLSAAREQAYSLHQQLIEIDREINQAEAAESKAEIDRLEHTQDATFELYTKKRRAELNQRKQEYAEKLMSFQRDRYSVSQDFHQSNSSSTSRTSTRGPSRTGTPQSISKGKKAAVQLDEDVEQAAGLDKFLGSEDPPTLDQQPASRPKPTKTISKTKPKKTTRLAGPGILPPKAAPARPKIDIMADEDFD
ncbi:hypothetical protein H072_6149 [Dactylellina haptotyla CBS 200.50]|uniref:Uncharacterized protein n=1 Tax=Dactylellina haptotyla (strain CBS 200.50) TaxID=1284197 RepID=S8AFW1_DACHA|nr:hypothetical protein H072_6149 [Dactylellina haptotyla CBS 200.50]